MCIALNKNLYTNHGIIIKITKFMGNLHLAINNVNINKLQYLNKIKAINLTDKQSKNFIYDSFDKF